MPSGRNLDYYTWENRPSTPPNLAHHIIVTDRGGDEYKWDITTSDYILAASFVGTTAAPGNVLTLGTATVASAPVTPLVEAGGVAGTTAAPVTVTTASLSGKTMTFVNGLLVSIV